MGLSEEKIWMKIEFKQETIERSQTKLENGTIPSNRVHLVHGKLGQRLRTLGLYKLLLGNHDQAREHFKEATRRRLERVRRARALGDEISASDHRNEAHVLRKALFTAALAADEDLLTETADETMAIDSGFVDRVESTRYDYYAAKAIASLVVDSDEVRDHLDGLEASLDLLQSGPREYYRSMMETVAGIRREDAEQTATGLQGVLAVHEGDVQGDPDTCGELVSVTATALFALAHQCGVDVEVESEFVPAEFVE